MTTPVRLLADQEISADLKADLAAYREHEVTFSLENSLARFEERIENGDLGPSGEGPGPSGGEGSLTAGQAAAQLTAGKLAAVLAIGAGLGFAAFQLAKSSPEPELSQREEPAALVAPLPSEREEPPPEEAADPEPPEAPPAEAGEAEEGERVLPLAPHATTQRAVIAPREEVEPEAQQEAPSEGPAASAAQSPPEPAPEHAVQGSDALKREIAQLGEIRRTLASSPRRALELAERGHREFRDGSLYQEREALALRALHALKDRDALEIRGQAFLLRYPKSSFAGEIERMIAE